MLVTLGLIKAVWNASRAIADVPILESSLSGDSRQIRISDITGNQADEGYLNIFNSESPRAFTIGWLKPKIFISSALVNNLSKEKLNIVLQHEIGHRNRRDPLLYLVLNFLKDLFWFIPLGKVVARYYKLHSEIACDERITTFGYDKFEIAKTLVDVAGGFHFQNQKSVVLHSFYDLLELRVRNLLGENIRKAARMPSKVLLVSVFIITMIISSMIGSWYLKADPYGFHSSIISNADACHTGHDDSSELYFLGIKCPHCSSGVKTESGIVCSH